MYLFGNFKRLLSKTGAASLSLLALVLFAAANVWAAKDNLDRTFGSWGKMISTNAGTEKAQDAIVQPDGKIVVVGGTAAGGADYDFLVQRYNEDGTPDETFGNVGRAVLPLGAYGEFANSVALHPSRRRAIRACIAARFPF